MDYEKEAYERWQKTEILVDQCKREVDKIKEQLTTAESALKSAEFDADECLKVWYEIRRGYDLGEPSAY